MYVCGICRNTSQLGEKATRIVLETRPKQYKAREDSSVVVGVGFETVKEVLACQTCSQGHAKS